MYIYKHICTCVALQLKHLLNPMLWEWFWRIEIIEASIDDCL